MKKNIFIATVQIAFEAENELGYAEDAISAIFTENLKLKGTKKGNYSVS